MKPVVGSITSSQSISLRKAAKILSRFVSTENGASQAVGVYIKRTSAAFNELIQFHKDLKSKKFDETQSKKSQLQDIDGSPIDEVKIQKEDVSNTAARVKQEDGFVYVQHNLNEEKADFDDRRKSEKKKKRRKSFDEVDDGERGGIENDVVSTPKKEKKKRRKMEDEKGPDGSNEKHQSTKKKRKKNKAEVED